MSFVDQIVIGHRAILRTMTITWENKTLLFYVLLKSIISSVVVAVASLLLGIGGIGIYKILHQWVTTLVVAEGRYILAIAFVVLVINIWLAMIFDVALLRRVMALLHRRELSFSKSFDFDKGMSVKLFWWSIIFVLVIGLILLAGAFFPPLLKYYLTPLLLLVWVVGILFVLPIFIKRNLTIDKAVKNSFELVWQQFFEILSAIISIFFYMVFIGLIVALIGFGLAWLTCYLLKIPFGIGITMPFILIMVVPLVLMSWYFTTVITALPATLYHGAIDKLR